jgi:choline dehydrogenase
MEAGVALVMEMARQQVLEPFCSEPEQVPASGAEADVRAFMRRHAQTLYHPVGTCAMGADDDAVVDLELRVRGVDGLRVVDASVMPTVPRGNTNAPVIATAERAADLIRGVRALAPETPARAEAPAA